MKNKLSDFPLVYLAALRIHLDQNPRSGPDSAQELGVRARSDGLHALDLVKLHEHAMVAEVLPGCPADERAKTLRRAGIFFAAVAATTGNEDVDKGASSARLDRIVATLSGRGVDLADANRQLGRDNTKLKAMEKSLKQSELQQAQTLEKSARMQEQLRRLSHRILSAQEDERKIISRELHDVIAQALTGINVRLALLKKEAVLNTKGLGRNIAQTQRLVAKSTNIVHQFARELRPSVLDDLGLIPALHSFMKNFTTRTGVRTYLTAFADVEKLDTRKRTVLFRVAQEALTNVARHAHATRVDVHIDQLAEGIRLVISDDGKSFDVQRVLQAKGGKHLGLLGMRERVEMVDGIFLAQSAPGEGTTITALIRGDRAVPRKKRPEAAPVVVALS
ncbi:MAG: sensor histidine kinase [Opitutales bacterium]|jgi:signal transduction histidine kinase